jgi:hypothetical protein
MASLHKLRNMPKEGDYFLSFDDLLKVICDASLGRDLVLFMLEILSVVTWKCTYSNNFPLIDISELWVLLERHPPLTCVPQGRPKKERYRKEDIRGPRG